LTRPQKECQDNLKKAGIDVEKLINKFNDLKARPKSDPSSKGYNIFDAEKSTDQNVKNFLNSEKGKGAGAFIWGQDIMVRKAFFNANPGRKIPFDASRALALIHEAIHLIGKSDADFGGSAKLNDLVIKSCYNRTYGHNDLTITGN
jgi:hypothetical protein